MAAGEAAVVAESSMGLRLDDLAGECRNLVLRFGYVGVGAAHAGQPVTLLLDACTVTVIHQIRRRWAGALLV